MTGNSKPCSVDGSSKTDSLGDSPPYFLSARIEDAVSDIAIEDTLLSAVNGQLFENSDPWTTIKSRLDLPSSHPGPSIGAGPPSPNFSELILAHDRSGVGYTPATEIHPASELSSKRLSEDIILDSVDVDDRDERLSLDLLSSPVARSLEDLLPLVNLRSFTAEFDQDTATSPLVRTLSPLQIPGEPLRLGASHASSRSCTPEVTKITNSRYIKPLDASRTALVGHVIAGPSLFSDDEDDEA